MQTNYEILELFPTPVLATILPPELASVVDWLYTQEMLYKEVDAANYGERSKDSYILNNPEANLLHNYIIEQTNRYGQDVLGYDYDEYRFSQSWVSYKHPGQHHTAHTHPNSMISGVLYFGEGLEEAPAIRMHKQIGSFNAPYIAPNLKKGKNATKYSSLHFDITPSPGLMILFPSNLMHSVPVNNTEKVRCSLAFNLVPKAGFGVEGDLTELKF